VDEFSVVAVHFGRRTTLAMRRQIVAAKADGERDLKALFATFVRQRASARLAPGGPFSSGDRRQIAALAIRHGLPAIFPVCENVEAGGLLSKKGVTRRHPLRGRGG
jgi:hypothetical protein